MPLLLQTKSITKKTKVDIVQVSGELSPAFYLMVDLAKIKIADTDNLPAQLKGYFGNDSIPLEAELEKLMTQIDEGRPANSIRFNFLKEKKTD